MMITFAIGRCQHSLVQDSLPESSFRPPMVLGLPMCRTYCAVSSEAILFSTWLFNCAQWTA